jgi:hypothetical protein
VQTTENSLVIEQPLPLKNPLKNEDSEGVATRSDQASSETQCISPSWDEVGAASIRKLTKKEPETEEQTGINGTAAYADENAKTKAEHAAGELMERVAQDPVVQVPAKKFGATIVDVFDLARDKVRFVEHESCAPKGNLGQPLQCRIHGATTTWWARPDGSEQICERCHPNPRAP